MEQYWILLLLPIFYWFLTISYQIVKLVGMWVTLKVEDLKRSFK